MSCKPQQPNCSTYRWLAFLYSSTMPARASRSLVAIRTLLRRIATLRIATLRIAAALRSRLKWLRLWIKNGISMAPQKLLSRIGWICLDHIHPSKKFFGLKVRAPLWVTSVRPGPWSHRGYPPHTVHQLAVSAVADHCRSVSTTWRPHALFGMGLGPTILGAPPKKSMASCSTIICPIKIAITWDKGNKMRFKCSISNFCSFGVDHGIPRFWANPTGHRCRHKKRLRPKPAQSNLNSRKIEQQNISWANYAAAIKSDGL